MTRLRAKTKKLYRVSLKLLLTGLVVLLTGLFVSYSLRFFHITHPSTQSPQTRVQQVAHGTKPAPTITWKSYTIPASTLSFRYPSTWKLNAGQSPLGPYASARTPQTTLIAPDNLYITILTDADKTTNNNSGALVLTRPIQTLGRSYYIDYIDVAGDGNVSYAALLTGPYATSDYPSIIMPAGITNRLVVSISYIVSSGPSERSLSFYQMDPSMQDVLTLIGSLSN